MGVLERGARPAVGGKAQTEVQLVQGCLAHLDVHRRGQRLGAVGVEGDVGRTEIATAHQALLGLHQLALVVVLSGFEPRQPWHQDRVVTLQTTDLRSTELEQGPGIQLHAEIGGLSLGIDLGRAAANAPAGVVSAEQFAQGLILGIVPAFLGEGPSHWHWPAALDALGQLGPLGRIAALLEVGGCRQAEGNAAHLGGRTGIDLQLNACPPVRGLAQAQLDVRTEMPQSAQQVLHILSGRGEKLLEFARVQVGDGAVALQLHVFEQQFTHGLGRLHLQVETRSLALSPGHSRSEDHSADEQGDVFHARSLGWPYLVSRRMASSRPRKVRGYMR